MTHIADITPEGDWFHIAWRDAPLDEYDRRQAPEGYHLCNLPGSNHAHFIPSAVITCREGKDK